MTYIPVGLEMYSVRKEFAANPYATMKAVKAMGYEGVEFAVADQVAAGLERLDGGLAPTVLVVPAVGRPVKRFAECDRLTGHADQIVGRIVVADAGRQTRRHPFGGWMQPWPFSRALNQSQRQFVD